MDPEIQRIAEPLAISLALGMLVGLQRQHVEEALAGLRTFALVSVAGTLAAMLDGQIGAHGWVVAAGLAGIVAVTAVGTWLNAGQKTDHGITTEVALILMYLVGAYLFVGETAVAIAVGAGAAVLLQFKAELHGIVARLGGDDLRAIMQFVLITFIVLPLLPNRTYDPFDVLNPRDIWLMVCLIVGISLGGYIIYKFFGQNVGMFLGGMLGGAISSTATTVSYARRMAGATTGERTAALVIAIASMTVYARVLIEIAVVSRGFVRQAAGPIGIAGGAGLLAAVALWLRVRREKDEMPRQENPTELRGAIGFALMYGVVLFALAGARKYEEQFGVQGLYSIAALSGLTDMDAITLSSARMVEQKALDPAQGWRLIILASLSNLLFKLGLVATLGNRALLKWTLLLFAPAAIAGGVLMAVWPQ